MTHLVSTDDFIHPTGVEPAWREAFYFDFFDPQTRVSGFGYSGVHPHQETGDVIFALWKEDVLLARFTRWDFNIPADIGAERLDFGPLCFRPLQPFQTWQIYFDDGFCRLNLTFEAIHQAYSWADSEQALAQTDSHHYEQQGRYLGTVRVGGRTLPANDPAASIEAGLGFLTEDRKNQGLVLQLSITDNITLTSLAEFSHHGVLDLAAEAARAAALVETLRIRAASLGQEVGDLSGGNQQKVVLARWLAARCKVLLFDEPTRGIDVGAKAEIYQLIGELAERGVAVLLISSEMPELLGLSDRIAVMHEGSIEGVLPRAEATQERIMELALQFTS